MIGIAVYVVQLSLNVGVMKVILLVRARVATPMFLYEIHILTEMRGFSSITHSLRRGLSIT
ncbi:hypothetical protein CWB99_18240 [Pseudoalteromonas rubra]|uniref:Uncharacterized protein n=1 Tax=Pseudoalteromonas rubra TaxID=43658 RepID=A0A5S3WIM5_9GAMM|nr:hypothetical protein CWB99_18240 [Pseudoalteromonas rubra]TMP35772.1 hypothetical protein CWC00_03580 [Pseudoalteromonas rubra]